MSRAPGALTAFVATSWRRYLAWGAVGERVKVFAIVAVICGLAVTQVLSRPKREGHDAFSSEKPAALRGGTSLDLAAEKAKLQ
jgi:hypothetical protein